MHVIFTVKLCSRKNTLYVMEMDFTDISRKRWTHALSTIWIFVLKTFSKTSEFGHASYCRRDTRTINAACMLNEPYISCLAYTSNCTKASNCPRTMPISKVSLNSWTGIESCTFERSGRSLDRGCIQSGRLYFYDEWITESSSQPWRIIM